MKFLYHPIVLLLLTAALGVAGQGIQCDGAHPVPVCLNTKQWTNQKAKSVEGM
jgi:hypothetical protein